MFSESRILCPGILVDNIKSKILFFALNLIVTSKLLENIDNNIKN